MSATVVGATGRNFAPHRFSSLFSSPAWIEVLARTYGFEILASTADDGNVGSAILFSIIRDLRGDRIVCLPFSDYCDPLVEDPKVWRELVEPLQIFNLPIKLRCLRNDIPAKDRGFTCDKSAKWHGIDLTRTEDELWVGLQGNARQNIRFAKRSGVTVRIGRAVEDVLTFHRMHALLRKKKYRLLAQPRSFFENLHRVFLQDHCSAVLLAELDGIPLAGILLLSWQNAIYYKFNASLDQRCRPNDLLVWHAILFGRQKGATLLDFGLSDPEQPGLVRFKQKFATEERDICFYEWKPNTEGASRNADTMNLLAQMTHLLTHPSVPDEITLEAGEKFYRFFA
jgi:CelD/BcsL family acetyltransferase involved in cellulose biosynthesis